MNKKAPLTWLIAGLVMALALIIFGCSTKNPWTPNPARPLVLSIVSGPADTLADGSTVTFVWTAKGGKGTVTYQYSFNGGTWTEPSNITNAEFPGLAGPRSYTMLIAASDEIGDVDTVSRVFHVAYSKPAIQITESPAESSIVAVGSTIFFSWDAYGSAGIGSDLQFQYSFAGQTSAYAPVRTVTYADVAAASPAIFQVWAKNASGSVSDTATVIFFIKNATILYVDDYQWIDAFGNVDRAKEREQKAFYRLALQGFAFAEWDNDISGSPTDADLASYQVVVWAADADNLCSADPTYRLYVDFGAEPDGGALGRFVNTGGKLLLTGAEALSYLYDTNPPSPTHFEAKFLGVSDTVINDSTWWLGGVAYDTLVVNPDSITFATRHTWQSDSDFTWCVKEAGAVGYPDSMKIDVAKNGNQLACSASLMVVKEGVTPIFTVGLDVGGEAPGNYGEPCGWLYDPPSGAFKTASLMFDTFAEPGPGIQETFRTILVGWGQQQP